MTDGRTCHNCRCGFYLRALDVYACLNPESEGWEHPNSATDTCLLWEPDTGNGGADNAL